MEKCVVLVSGGIDSATCLWWAKKEGWGIYGLTINYVHAKNEVFKTNDKKNREVFAAGTLSKKAGVLEHRIIDLEIINNPDADKLIGNNIGRYADGRPAAYIPCRNTIFYGYAAAFAEVTGSKWIVGGHNAEDSSMFPDARREYLDALNKVLELGTWIGKTDPVRIVTPLEKLTKSEVIALALELGVPVEDTWSCYESRTRACGTCHACLVRKEAFDKAGLKDPIEYDTG